MIYKDVLLFLILIKHKNNQTIFDIPNAISPRANAV